MTVLVLSAIDTGTTLIGGPSDAVQAVWAAVNGSQALKGNMEGFFAFRMRSLTSRSLFLKASISLWSAHFGA